MVLSGKSFHDDFLKNGIDSLNMAVPLAPAAFAAVLRTQPYFLPERLEEPEIIVFSKTWRQIYLQHY
jgi:hypothetical protein